MNSYSSKHRRPIDRTDMCEKIKIKLNSENMCENMCVSCFANFLFCHHECRGFLDGRTEYILFNNLLTSNLKYLDMCGSPFGLLL